MTQQWGPVFSGSYLIWNLEPSPQASCFAVTLDSPLLRGTNFLLIRILDFRSTSLFQSRLDKRIFWVGLGIWVQKAPGHTACWLRGSEMEVCVWCSYHSLSAKHIQPSTCIPVFSDILWVCMCICAVMCLGPYVHVHCILYMIIWLYSINTYILK